MRIPRYQSTAGKESALPGPRQSLAGSADPFGADTARVLTNAGTGLSKVGDLFATLAAKQKGDEADAWLSESKAKLANATRQYLLGSDDGVTPGAKTLQGKQAFDSVPRGAEFFDETAREIMGTAPFKSAGDKLREAVTAERTMFLGDLARHEAAQRKVYKLASVEQEVQQQAQSFVAHYDAPIDEIRERFTKLIEPGIKNAATMKGLPADGMVRQAKSRLYEDIIGRLIAEGKTAEARLKLEAFNEKTEIEADAATRLGKAIRSKEIVVQAVNTAEDIYNRLSNQQITVSDAHAEVNKIEDPELMAKTKSAVNARISQWKIDQAVMIQGGQADIIQKMNDAETQQQRWDILEALPEGNKVQKEIKKAAKAQYIWHSKMHPGSPRTEPDLFDKTLEQIEEARITNKDQLNSIPGLAEADKKTFATLLDKSQKVNARMLKEAYALSKGWGDGKKLSSGHKNRRGEFMRWAAEMIKDNNKAQDPGYAQDLADMWVMHGERKGGGWIYRDWGKDMPYGEARKKGALDTWLPAIVPDAAARGDDAMTLTQSRAADIQAAMKKNKPIQWQNYLHAAKDDAVIAARMAWRDYIDKRARMKKD